MGIQGLRSWSEILKRLMMIGSLLQYLDRPSNTTSKESPLTQDFSDGYSPMPKLDHLTVKVLSGRWIERDLESMSAHPQERGGEKARVSAILHLYLI